MGEDGGRDEIAVTSIMLVSRWTESGTISVASDDMESRVGRCGRVEGDGRVVAGGRKGSREDKGGDRSKERDRVARFRAEFEPAFCLGRFAGRVPQLSHQPTAGGVEVSNS